MISEQNPIAENPPEIVGLYIPKSLVGRSLFFLATMPIIRIAFIWVWLFFSRIKTNIAAGNFSPRKFDSLQQTEKFFTEYFAAYLPNQILGFIRIYLDCILTFGASALLVYAAYRFLKNKTFSVNEYFRTWVIALAIFPFWRMCAILYYTFSDFSGQQAPEMYVIDSLLSVFSILIAFVLCYLYLRIIFKKIPFPAEPVWANEFSAKEYFYKFSSSVKTFVKGKGLLKAILILLVLLALDIISAAMFHVFANCV